MARFMVETETKMLSGETESIPIDTSYLAIFGLFVPTIDSSTLTFKVDAENSVDWVVLKDKAGASISFTVGTGGIALSSDDLSPLAAYRHIKIVLSATQTADRVFCWVLKT